MRVALALLVLLTAGCLQPAPASDAPAIVGDIVTVVPCPDGQVQAGLDATGAPLCAVPQPPAPVDLTLKGGYSSRQSADAAMLDRVMLVVALAPGSGNLSLDQVRLWHGNGTDAREYGGQASNDLSFRWLRGSGPLVMTAGDIVELAYEPIPHLPPRTVFNVTIIPGAGDAIEATLETVSSFGNDTTYVLLSHAPPAREAQPVATGLNVMGIYGERASTTSPITRLRIMVELAAEADALDLEALQLRLSHDADVTTLSAAETTRSWVRGDGADDLMRPGDLVELACELPRPLHTRTSVQFTLVPEAGAPVSADFKTPPTYGADLVITLR